MDDVTQIPQDLVSEGAAISKDVAKGVVETLGTVGGQLTGKKLKKRTDAVEELEKREEEFKKRAIPEILARLSRMRQEEERLRQEREEERKGWVIVQREKLAPPQIQRKERPRVIPQVAKQRTETKVGWGAG